MLKDKLTEVLRNYTSSVSLESFGLYPGSIVYITNYKTNNKFLAKIVFTVEAGVVKSLENTEIAKSFVSEGKDGIYYTLASFNYANNKVVTVLDFVAGGVEFLPLSSFKLDWDTRTSVLPESLLK